MLRPIDAYTLNNALVSWYNDTEDETEKIDPAVRLCRWWSMPPTLTSLNEALTMEQLTGNRKTTPAYLKVFDPLLQSGWHIIKAVTEDKIIFRGWHTVYVPISGMGVDYNLYRRPPEGEDGDATRG